MNKNILLTLIVLVFFSTWLNSALAYASFSKALNVYPKSVIAAPNTIWVPDNYTTIQEAINMANEGETILVEAGTYYEHVIVNKPLSLVGENKQDTIIDGSGAETIVNIIASNITLSGFTIQNGGLGIYLWGSSNNVISGNDVSNNGHGIYLSYSGDNVVSGNNVSENEHGIYLEGSSYNTLTGNDASNNGHGIYLSYSGDNVVSGNNVSENEHGIYLEGSSYNTLTGNDASNNNGYGIRLYHSGSNVLSGNDASNNGYGIYVDDSDNNIFSGNVLPNNEYGIHLSYSGSNVLSGNDASNNGYGIYLWGSSNNVISGNDVSNNGHGIYLSYSGDNVVSGNNVSENEHGIYLWGSSNNIFFQNNFINCTEPSSSIASVDSWDNGVEGNYWSDYNGTDTDWDGINDTPYHISENSRDNYPLMARFLQFNIVAENQSYRITTVCNFTISDFQCYYDLDAKTNAVSFNVNSTGDKGFCRISIPHALIDPPFKVRIDSRPPSYSKKVYANGTHTWLYFAYDHSEHEVTIVHTPPSEQLLWSQWSIIGLAITVAILFLIGVRYYRLFNKQKKVIEAYEREVGSFPVSHEERARMRFVKDVIEREEKLEKFKAKYGIKIQPANTLTDVMEKLGVQKES
jgi:parallel beta-helix repeat protein